MQDVKKDRDRYIGGSDIPIIMGLSPFKTRWQLLQEKAGLLENTFEGNQYTEYGNIMEPKIRAWINQGEQADFMEYKYEESFMRYHADGFDGMTNTLLEIKTTSRVHENAEEYKSYLVQLLYGMCLYKCEDGILAVYERPEDFNEEFDPFKLQIFKFKLSDFEELAEEAVTAAHNFWEDLQALKAFPELKEEDLVPAEVKETAHAIELLEDSISRYKQVEQSYKAMKEQLKSLMEQNNIKTWQTPGGTKFTLVPDSEDKEVWKFDEDKFAAENVDLWKKYKVKKTQKGKKGYVRITLKEEQE